MKLNPQSRLHPLTFAGLLSLAVANVARMLMERHWSLSEHIVDPTIGFLYGVAIACMVLGISRQRRGKRAC